MQERLQKYISRCGKASRRKAEEMILSGRVKVNGKVINEIVMVDDEHDKVEIDGEIICPEEKMIYIILNKPEGIITSVKDQFGRKTVIDIIDIKERVYPVGRLDYDTSGLILLTNDGDLANKIMRPKSEINKVYIAKIFGTPNKEEINMFESGVVIDGYKTSKAGFKIIRELNNYSIAEIRIHEGRNRQVRKMCEVIEHPVISLKRVMIGDIKLGDLRMGEWRYLNESEIQYLKNL